MPNILLLNDTSDHDNWGSIAGAAMIKTIIRENVADANIISIPSAWTTRRFRQASRRLGGKVYWKRNRILDRFSHPYRFLPSVADEFDLVADEWLKGVTREATEDVLKKLRMTEVVVFHAEGSTYRTNTSAIRCLFILWMAKTKFKIPALFLNGSVTLTEVDPVLPAMAGKVFRSIDAVAVREPYSLRNVNRWFPDVKADLIPDSVFRLAGEDPVSPSGRVAKILRDLGDRPYFCLSLSMLVSMQPGYMRFGAKSSALFMLIERLKTLGLRPVLMARDGMDQRIVQDLAKATEAVFIGDDFHYSEIQEILSHARFMVSGRYHHLILATIMGCPGIPLRTSSHKVDGLSELIGDAMGAAFDPTDLYSHMDEIVDRARVILNDDGLRERLKQKAANFRRDTRRLGELVGHTIDRGPV